MTIKLITYDLHQPDKDYNSLYEEIKSLGDCINPLKSVWLVKTTLSSEIIIERLKKVADKDDDFIVVQYDTPDRSAYMTTKYVNWVKENL
ncbi:hypothetical protein P4H09_16030 [Bacillus cereus]|uniref:hypothetical protein n=1 Tax=Bacillus thuringiensis TaxID=1428 RepID=UPI000BF3EF22|nr:hypothetical protein [Bacillus thuringiensis]MEB8690419.1 hypothetical protein [Bacillus cereus]PEZ41329.1 hypothetical protein CN346_00055 [Bacillus thuringiensis]